MNFILQIVSFLCQNSTLINLTNKRIEPYNLFFRKRIICWSVCQNNLFMYQLKVNIWLIITCQESTIFIRSKTMHQLLRRMEVQLTHFRCIHTTWPCIMTFGSSRILLNLKQTQRVFGSKGTLKVFRGYVRDFWVVKVYNLLGLVSRLMLAWWLS